MEFGTVAKEAGTGQAGQTARSNGQSCIKIDQCYSTTLTCVDIARAADSERHILETWLPSQHTHEGCAAQL